MKIEDLPEPLDVIAVGAHPDDVEVAIGGSVARLVDLGYRVGIVDLTDGEPTPLSPGPDHRMQEAQRAGEILGIQERLQLDLGNRKLFDNFENRVALAKVFRRFRPSIVIGIADRTPMASPDHLQASLITEAGIFYSRLTKWDDVFDHLPVHTITKHLCYPLGLRDLSPANMSGQFIMDISTTLDRKLKAIAEYGSQFPPEKQRVFELLEAQNRYFGQTAGFAAGELLLAPTPLGVDDPIRAFLPNATRPHQ